MRQARGNTHARTNKGHDPQIRRELLMEGVDYFSISGFEETRLHSKIAEIVCFLRWRIRYRVVDSLIRTFQVFRQKRRGSCRPPT